MAYFIAEGVGEGGWSFPVTRTRLSGRGPGWGLSKHGLDMDICPEKGAVPEKEVEEAFQSWMLSRF